MTFDEVKKEIFGAAQESGKKTFSESAFNRLTSALVNESGYQVTVAKQGKSGEEKVLTPVDDFRKSVIGGIAKSAGLDDAEANSMVENYKFPANTPWYPVVSEAVTNYLEADKAFTFIPKADMNCSLKIKTIPETIKMNGGPNTPKEERKPVVYGQYRKVKATSVCPKSLRKAD